MHNVDTGASRACTMDERVQRRVATLAGQVESATSSAAVGPELQHTSSQAGLASQSVVLPERLSDPGPWRVRRCGMCRHGWAVVDEGVA